MGGGHQLSEPGEDQNARDRVQCDMFVTGLDENAVPVDELVQKKCFFFYTLMGQESRRTIT